MAVIQMLDIQKVYAPKSRAPVHALRGIELFIEQGEMVAIQGRSGSGKSTLLHIIGCVDSASRGKYYLKGRPVNSLNPAGQARLRREEFGFVLQQFGLIPERKVWENVALPLMFSGKCRDIKKKSLYWLSQVGLEKLSDRRASELSGGEQQRVAIARALVHDPNIILADEPTGNLDSRTSGQIMRLFGLFREMGKTVVVVTHDDAVAGCCDRVLHIQDGKIVS